MTVTVEIPLRYVRDSRRRARERNQSFEDHDGWDNEANTWGRDPETRNFIGLLGEIAFARYADLQLDTATYQWSDGGGDFRVRIDGQELDIDIKTRRNKPYTLWVKEYAVKADYYVLGHLQGPHELEHGLESVDLAGWQVTFFGTATREQLLDAVKIESDFGHENYSILLDDLDPLLDPDAIEPC